jgi:hypothetical protein
VVKGWATYRLRAEIGMIGMTKRDAGFPGERFTFEASPDVGAAGAEVNWTGGGSPATGSGRTFTTVFSKGGTFRVAARAGAADIDFTVTVCPIDEWLARARTFYGRSIDFSPVKVRASRLVLGPPGTGWTCNDVIRFKRARRSEDLPHESTLIHELAHVWEHQSGQAQLLKGASEQIGRLFGRDPYDFGGPAGVKISTTLTTFSKESQAQIVTEYWKSKHGYQADAKGVPFTTAGYIEDLERLVVGAGIGTRLATRRVLVGRVDAAIGRIVNGLVGLVGKIGQQGYRPVRRAGR